MLRKILIITLYSIIIIFNFYLYIYIDYYFLDITYYLDLVIEIVFNLYNLNCHYIFCDKSILDDDWEAKDTEKLMKMVDEVNERLRNGIESDDPRDYLSPAERKRMIFIMVCFLVRGIHAYFFPDEIKKETDESVKKLMKWIDEQTRNKRW